MNRIWIATKYECVCVCKLDTDLCLSDPHTNFLATCEFQTESRLKIAEINASVSVITVSIDTFIDKRFVIRFQKYFINMA